MLLFVASFPMWSRDELGQLVQAGGCGRDSSRPPPPTPRVRQEVGVEKRRRDGKYILQCGPCEIERCLCETGRLVTQLLLIHSLSQLCVRVKRCFLFARGHFFAFPNPEANRATACLDPFSSPILPAILLFGRLRSL